MLRNKFFGIIWKFTSRNNHIFLAKSTVALNKASKVNFFSFFVLVDESLTQNCEVNVKPKK